MVDYIIILIIAVAVFFAIKSMKKAKDNGTCVGCKGCGTSGTCSSCQPEELKK